LGACIRPVHTRFDGDIVFAVSCGSIEADVEIVAEAAFGATAAAIERSVKTAAG
jgi:L-aminopeptidase/D-esterase-like protein